MKPDSTQPTDFHVMAKPAGAMCNLDCGYCYYLSKELLYPGSRFRMADALLESYIRQYIEAQRGDEVNFAWQGGEPTLMGRPFFERVVQYQQKYRRPGMRITNALQTNGTLLDDEWCQFFKEHHFLIGISLDGPQKLHDIHRRNQGGASAFSLVMNGWRLLQEYNVETNILCTVHAQNQDFPLEIYRYFRDELGARFMQFIPIVERATRETLPLLRQTWHQLEDAERILITQTGSQVSHRTVGARRYGEFLIAIFDEWVRRDVGQVFVQLFDVALGAWLGQPGGLCIFAPTCGRALALEHNGDLYSCDHFVEPRYRLGNIQTDHLVDLVAAEPQQQFGQMKQTTLPGYCRRCPVLFACHGGCPKNRFIHTPNGEPGLNYLCAGYKAFFSHINQPMTMMAQLIRQNRPPTEIMRTMAEADEAARQHAFNTAGRNDPCPCGSGMKFKKCHGRNPGRDHGKNRQ